MRLSHIHIAFEDFPAAVQFFQNILGLKPTEKTADMAVFRCDGFEIAVHPDWGQGDTVMTLAFQSDDCQKDYLSAVKNGATPRNPPRNKTNSINADIYGPGKVVIEFEQLLTKS